MPPNSLRSGPAAIARLAGAAALALILLTNNTVFQVRKDISNPSHNAPIQTFQTKSGSTVQQKGSIDKNGVLRLSGAVISGGVTLGTGSYLTLSAADTRYVNTSGDTMTGALGIRSGNGAMAVDAGVLLEIGGTMSGRTIHAQDLLSSSGALAIEGAAAFGSTAKLNGVTYTFPTGDGSASGKLLATNSAGQLSWTSPAVSGITNLGTITAAASNVGSSSVAELTSSPTYTGTGTIPAGLAAGSVIEIALGGGFRLDSGDVSIRVKMGGTTIAYFNSGTATTATRPWYLHTFFTVRSAGSSGKVIGEGLLQTSILSTSMTVAATADSGITPTVEQTINTTTTNAITVTVQFSASDADHFVGLHSGYIRIHSAPT